MTLCERCVHKNVCEIRSVQDEDDERALAECSDFFEIVRCKDCEFYKLRNVSSHYKPTKPCCLRKAAVTVNENDYCSYGKRKEGAE